MKATHESLFRSACRLRAALGTMAAVLVIASSADAAIVTIDFNAVHAATYDAYASLPPLPLPAENGITYLAEFGVEISDVTGPGVVIRHQSRDFFDAVHAGPNALLQPGGFLDEWVGYTLHFSQPVYQVDIYLAVFDEDILDLLADLYPDLDELHEILYPAHRLYFGTDPIPEIEIPNIDYSAVSSSFGAAAGYEGYPGMLGDSAPANRPTFTSMRIEGNAHGTALFNNLVIDKLVVHFVPEPGSLTLGTLAGILVVSWGARRKLSDRRGVRLR